MESNEKKALYVTGKVIKHNIIKSGYYKMIIEAPEIAGMAKPGQFVMMSRWQMRHLLLKRPFSFFDIDNEKGTFTVFYKKVGKGTKILSESVKNDEVELIGPCGNGFWLPQNIGSIALVARGIGVATMMPLARKAKRMGLNIYSFISAREKTLLFGKDELKAISTRIFFTTDDDWQGSDGKVTFFLEELLKDNIRIDAAYTCGSKRLARHIKNLQKEYNFSAYISLEERMGCGIGSCKGCIISTIHGYQRVCKEGPVFSLEEVILDEK